MDINIFTQIGLVVLVGLASKNAILIVEFAKVIRRSGKPIRRGDAGGLPAAAAADHHDLDGVHPGRAAAACRPRRRRRDAAVAGHGRLQRHAGRDALRHLADAGLLLPDRHAERVARVRLAAGAADRLDRAGDPHPQLPVAAVALGLRPSPAKPAAARRSRPRARVRVRTRRSSSWNRSDDPVFSRFFIDRPIFASVLSIIITLAGGIALFTLPVAQYPEITPPTVEVSAYYPGANAQVVADTVAAPIEQQVNGVENMMYMSSQCTNDGTYTLTVTFKHGVDLNMAQVLVQNRESLAEPILPDLVKRRGVAVKKKSPSILMIVNVFSPDDSRDNLYLSNYATIQLRDELARLRRRRRHHLHRPARLQHAGLARPAEDVVPQPDVRPTWSRRSTQQNIQVAAGQLGQPPVAHGPGRSSSRSRTLGRLIDAEQFADMILKTDAQGGIVRLRDVATIELGAQGYDQACTLDGQPSVALSVYQRPGSNALETAELVRDKMEELKDRFPDGLDYAIVYDTTPFITESVNEVFKTLRDAVILVAFVVLLFLQNWRSAIIPLVAVPVAIVGTFAVMAALGFSLNNLTLFGLVLAIGIVVDDAIVVVEAVEHHIEHGLAPRDATIMAMNQVSAPVIAVGLVLTAVFVPCAFITGITGQFYRQFALTIATSTVISAFNSLTLEPGAGGASAAAASRRACSRRCRGRPSWRSAAGRAMRSSARNCSSCRRPPACSSTLPGVSTELAASLVGLAVGRPGRLAGQRRARTASSAGPSTCSTRRSTRRRRSTPGWSAGCCGSASWCSCSTAACWG